MLQNRFLEAHKMTHFCTIPGYLWDREYWESDWDHECWESVWDRERWELDYST